MRKTETGSEPPLPIPLRHSVRCYHLTCIFNWVIKLRRTKLLFDIAGIALFTIVGVEKA
jgi:hypothetical protein